MATDLSKSSFDQVLDLIKEQNSLSAFQLTGNDVDLSDLNALIDHPSGKNTELTVTSKPNARYTGNVPIVYNRLLMSGLTQYGELTISIAEGDGEGQIINAINTAYGTNLNFDDITIAGSELVDFDGEIVTFTAKATSLAWIGEISLIVKWNQIELDSILTNSILPGLLWPVVRGPILDGEWSILSAVLPSTSNGHTAVVKDNILYIIGGGTTSAASSARKTVYRFNLDTRTFLANGAVFPGAGLQYGSSALIGNYIYIYGGSTTAGGFSTMFYRYDTVNDVWSSGLAAGPTAQVRGKGCSYQDKMLIHGMHYGNSDGNLMASRLHIYNATTNSWSFLETPLATKYSGIAVIEDTVYICGGLLAANGFSRELWSYNFTTQAWLRLADKPADSNDAMMANVNGYLYMYGGSNTIVKDLNMYRYDPDADEWSILFTFPDASFYRQQLQDLPVYNGKLYIAGGHPGATPMENKIIEIT